MQLIGNAGTKICVVMLALPRATSFLSPHGGLTPSLISGSPPRRSSSTIFTARNPLDSILNLWDAKKKDDTENQKSGKNGLTEGNNPPTSTSVSWELLSPTRKSANQENPLQSTSTSPSVGYSSSASTSTLSSNTSGKDNKFDFVQRIESVKCAVIGAISASVAVAPIALLHHITTSLPQWELTTDMAAIQGALFAIVYRYAIRNDDNPMLNQGVLGAFVLVRTLPTIQASPDCTALPLQCGEPLGYFNWSMLNQAIVQGLESAVLFGGAYLALGYAFSKGWISKFE